MSESGPFLIELGCDPPRWWAGESSYQFINSAELAMQFARRKDAERALSYIVKEGWSAGCKVVELSNLSIQPRARGRCASCGDWLKQDNVGSYCEVCRNDKP